jgi:hypothetical protein
MSAPCVVIRLEFERRPVVFADYLTESEEIRMADWLGVHGDYAELVARALELATEERAA